MGSFDISEEDPVSRNTTYLPDTITQSKVVFLTGAGASVPLGLPTTAQFLDEFRNLAVNLRLPEANHQDDFARFIVDRLYTSNPADIEEVLSKLEADAEWVEQAGSDHPFLGTLVGSIWDDFRTLALGANLPTRNDTLQKQLVDHLREGLIRFRKMNKDLTDAIRDEVIDRYGNLEADKAESLYRGLLGIWKDQFVEEFQCGDTLPFFTLNYDVALEIAAERLGIRLIDGFSTRPTGSTWSPDPFMSYGPEHGRLNLVLVKLHGSVKLGRNNEGVLVELPLGLKRDPRPHQHAVLYPTLGRKQLDQEPYRTNYTILRSCLLHATLLVVIGCSLRDRELNDLIRECVIENTSLHVLVVGPDADCHVAAARLSSPLDRIGGAIGRFDFEDEETLTIGRGKMINMLRRWMWAAEHNRGVYRFGSNQRF
jgi:hypothetical protein